MKVKVDPDLCTACGVCEDIAPDVFSVGDEVAEVKVDEVPADQEEAAQEAIESCPTEAISAEQ